MSIFEKYLYLASSYPYLQEDKKEQKCTLISKNCQNSPNQNKNDSELFCFKSHLIWALKTV